MMKKILPTLIGAALAGGLSVAVADVTLFGHIDTSYDYHDQDGGTDGSNLICTTCSVGFKGSEDLGNGLKAIFLIDFQYETTEQNGVTDRDQWLGLGGVFGQLRLGTISTVYKSHGAMLDPIYRTAQQQRDRGLQSDLHSGAGEDGQGRANNTVRYDSPTWNGLGIGAHYTLQNDTAENSTDSPWGIGGQWNSGPFLVFADYITNDAGGDDSAWKLGGKFDISMFSFLAQYESDDGLISAVGGNQTTPGSGDGADTWMVGATATMGNAMAYVGWAQADGGSGGSIASRYNVWQLVGTYNMSKRTMLYGGFSEIDCKDQDNNVCSAVGTSGGEDDKLSIGMKHTF